jgi:predicted RNase H-like HicB family nuclease
MKYRTVYARDEDGRWNVDIPSVKGCYTYGRSISQARARIREALGLYIEDAERAELEEQIVLPADTKRDVAQVQALRERVDAETEELDRKRYQLVAKLRQQHIGHRDIGEILGVSHQRAHQIERTPRTSATKRHVRKRPTTK